MLKLAPYKAAASSIVIRRDVLELFRPWLLALVVAAGAFAQAELLRAIDDGTVTAPNKAKTAGRAIDDGSVKAPNKAKYGRAADDSVKSKPKKLSDPGRAVVRSRAGGLRHVGDEIDISTVAGTVESITMRATQIRAADGTLWTVPNGAILRVGNQIILNMPANITFDVDSAIVQPTFNETLIAVGLVLKKFNKTVVDVYGHTDGDMFWWITNGIGDVMPPLGVALDEDAR